MPVPAVRKLIGVELSAVSVAEKVIAAAGGGLAILLLFAVARAALPVPEAAAVVASMGATAVLLFGVPHGPLSQPWPVVAGHAASAAIGVACARFVPHPPIAAACAVGLAIGVMHQLKCIHPPGGATAFTAVAGGPAVADLGWGFVLCPILANALVMVALAVALNAAFPWRRYPAALSRPPSPLPRATAPPTHEQVVAAVRSLDSFVDISEDDLLRLVDLLSPGRDARPQGQPARGTSSGRAPAP